MKKRLLALLLAAIMVFAVFAACGNGEEPEVVDPTPQPTPQPTPPEPPDEEDPEEVVLRWAMWDYDNILYYRGLADGFTELNPHVTFEFIDLGAAEFEQIAQTHLLGGTSYDIINVRDIPSYANLVDNGLLLPLNDKLAANNVNTSAFAGNAANLLTIEETGNLYALPLRTDFWVVFYNKDIFDAAGVDYPTNNMTLTEWEALIREVGEASEDGIYGNVFHTWASTTSLFGIVGGDRTVVDGHYDWMYPSYEMVLGLENDGFVPRRTEMQAGSIHHNYYWFNGYNAMVNMGTWHLNAILSAMRGEGDWADTETTNWGIVNYPVPAGVPHGYTIGQIKSLGIPMTSEHVDEAMAFLAFATASERGSELVADAGSLPAFMTTGAMDVILALPGMAQDANTIAALNPVNIVLEMPLHSLSGDINAIRNEVHDDIMSRAVTIREGLNRMNEEIGALLEDAGYEVRQ